MAHFWEEKYHADNTEKHNITKEELQFLIDLQKELNTQESYGQADPKYWVIRDYEKIYGSNLEDADGIAIFDSDTGSTVYEGEIPVFYGTSEDISKIIEILEANEYELSVEEKELINSSYNTDSLVLALEEAGFCVLEYKTVPKESNFFFTQKAAQNHLRLNDYHYCDEAHSYAHTVWRSEEEKLWDILRKVDWTNIDELLNQADEVNQDKMAQKAQRNGERC